jgi:hypothetical protein
MSILIKRVELLFDINHVQICSEKELIYELETPGVSRNLREISMKFFGRRQNGEIFRSYKVSNDLVRIDLQIAAHHACAKS